MEKQIDSIEVTSFGQVFQKKGTNTRTPYSHQKNAMEALDKMNQESSFSTLVLIHHFWKKFHLNSVFRLECICTAFCGFRVLLFECIQKS